MPKPAPLTFPLKDEEFIELNKLLKIFNLVETGGEANNLITQGMVRVNGEVDTRKRRKMRAGDRCELDGVVIKVV